MTGKLVAKVPFKISINKTTIPAFFPKTRNVLVVPVLPLPNWRISFLKNSWPIQTPEGIEPKR